MGSSLKKAFLPHAMPYAFNISSNSGIDSGMVNSEHPFRFFAFSWGKIKNGRFEYMI